MIERENHQSRLEQEVAFVSESLENLPSRVLSLLASHYGEICSPKMINQALFSDDVFLPPPDNARTKMWIHKIRKGLREKSSDLEVYTVGRSWAFMGYTLSQFFKERESSILVPILSDEDASSIPHSIREAVKGVCNQVHILGNFLIPLLGTNERRLLILLASQPGHLFTREEIVQKVWGEDLVSFYGLSRNLLVCVCRLRKDLTNSSLAVRTSPGRGYYLEIEKKA